MNKLANNIVKLRVMNGLSQDDLAEKVGVSRQTVHKWEKGLASPKGENLKLLCEAFECNPDKLFGREPLILDKKIEIAIDELKTDLKEQDAETKEKSKKKLKKKLIRCFFIIFLVLILIYVCFVSYKFIVLTNIENKISKYQKLDNYYCEIKTYDNERLSEKKNIWYKNQKYKIENSSYNDDGETVRNNTTIINLKENTKTIYSNGEREGKIRELTNIEEYADGVYMYSLFPDTVKINHNNKMQNSLKLKNISLLFDKESNEYCLRIENIQVKFEKNTFIPICYSVSDNNKFTQYFKVDLNNVSDDDLNY